MTKFLFLLILSIALCGSSNAQFVVHAYYRDSTDVVVDKPHTLMTNDTLSMLTVEYSRGKKIRKLSQGSVFFSSGNTLTFQHNNNNHVVGNVRNMVALPTSSNRPEWQMYPDPVTKKLITNSSYPGIILTTLGGEHFFVMLKKNGKEVEPYFYLLSDKQAEFLINNSYISCTWSEDDPRMYPGNNMMLDGKDGCHLLISDGPNTSNVTVPKRINQL